MFCEKCGAVMPQGSRFCENCGAAAAGGGQQGPAPQQTYAQPQPAYNQPRHYNQAAGSGSGQAHHEPLGIGSYIWMFLLSAIPVIGFIVLLVWAFGGSVNLNKKNYARAILIMCVIGVALSVIVVISGGSVLGSALFNLNRAYYRLGGN